MTQPIAVRFDAGIAASKAVRFVSDGTDPAAVAVEPVRNHRCSALAGASPRSAVYAAARPAEKARCYIAGAPALQLCRGVTGLDKEERALRQGIIDNCRWMNASGINQGASGNISARWGTGCW